MTIGGQVTPRHPDDCACYPCTFAKQVEEARDPLFDRQLRLQLRLPDKATSAPGVNWAFIDPWLHVLKARGALAFLSRETGIHPNTLQARRVALKLPPLPKGRPSTKTLTAREAAVLQATKQGTSQGQIAMNLGITQQAVSQSLQRAKQKEGMYCDTCKGVGVEPCFGCYLNGPHFHICNECGGQSSYSAAPPKEG